VAVEEEVSNRLVVEVVLEVVVDTLVAMVVEQELLDRVEMDPVLALLMAAAVAEQVLLTHLVVQVE
jgi:hypothetical protein